MKILHVAPIYREIPPRGYGGTERVVHLLATLQAAHGHEAVVLGVKSADAQTLYEIKSYVKRTSRSSFVRNLHAYTSLLEISKDFDVVHFHVLNSLNVVPVLKILNVFLDVPAYLTTLHADPPLTGFKRYLYTKISNHPLVAISHSQAERVRRRGYRVVAVVYHGIDVKSYPFCRDKEDYFVYVGRIDRTKGVHVAVEAARKAGKRLVIAGPVADNAYFEEHIKPYLGANITYLGEVPENEKRKLLCKAKALIYPVQYEEFFGLILIEALATGTPVIGFVRGSVAEIVEDSITGFLAKDLDEVVYAMNRIDAINPVDCRRRAEERFSDERMFKDYEFVYKRLVGRGP